MKYVPSALKAFTAILIYLTGIPFVLLTQELDTGNPQIREMIDIVTSTSSEVRAQSSLAAVTASVPDPRAQRGLTSTSVGISSNFWDQDQDELQVAPTASLSFTFSFRDPNWSQNRIGVEEARTQAERAEAEIRAGLVEQLFDALDELTRLEGEEQRLVNLRQQLAARLAQIRNERVVVSLEQVWQVEERILTTDAELLSARKESALFRSRTAMLLGGSRWEELLLLLRHWSTRT